MAEETLVNKNTGKPLQSIPWSQKTKEWFRDNGEYYLSRGNFSFGNESGQRKDTKVFYEVYNNQFPMEWFKHIIDPLSAKKSEHKAFGAKIRPVSILRTNIDLLLGEYPRRPFVYNVVNLGENGSSMFLTKLNDTLHQNVLAHFTQAALVSAQESGQELTPEQIAQLQKDPPMPEDVKTNFHLTYKDALTVKGQKWLRKILREKNVKKKLHKMFKDWLIAGETYSYKGIRHDQLVYRRISPGNIDYDKSSENDLIEDGEWGIELRLLTAADVTDEFYDKLKEQDVKNLEGNYQFTSPTAFYSSLIGLYTGSNESNKIPVYCIQWKGKKKVNFVSYTDPETMQLVEEELDEDFDTKLLPPGAKVEVRWPTEVYEVEMIGGTKSDSLMVNWGPAPVQRSPMNGSGCKLSFNGRKYSDTNADNISVLEMGLPFQLLYIIVTYILEKTIAKSKGKIFLFDHNAIPNKEDWDEEKFFYYSEALGYALLDRNQIGVDKSWNQYQVVDMSLFDSIEQLIRLKESIKQEWDDLIGVSRQRKGQTYASDGVGSNERAVFQSTVITDMIFIGFEEFVESELQGFMDYAKILNANGHRSLYNDDDFGTMLMEISPEDFIHEDIGVFVDGSSEHIEKLRKMEQFAQAMLQNNAKPSTIMEIVDTINSAELKAKLKRIEEIEQDIASQQADNEQEHQKMLEEIAQRHAEYAELLKRDTMEAEYDRKEDLEYIKGSFNTFTFSDGDSNDNGVPDTTEVQKMNNEREKLFQQWEKIKADRETSHSDRQLKMAELNHKINTDRTKLSQNEKKLKIDAKKAAQRPKATSK